MKPLLLMLAFAATATMAWAADKTFESGPQRVHLIELFTSEGCSSCPPAEAWLSKLKNDPGLWKNFVPLAFHVDYWDHLGWKDPFAQKEWTKRQYEYSARWASESVYTPGFVLDGSEWRGFSPPPPARGETGILRVSLVDRKVSAEFHTNQDIHGTLLFHLALLADGSSQVTAGENRGRKLDHSFVVLSLTKEKMEAGRLELSLPEIDPRAGAMAAWLTTPEFDLIQAVGGWLR